MSARRPYTTRVHCQHSGCRETAFYESDTRRDERETRERYVGKWKCSRHSAPNKVLGPDSAPRVVEITAKTSDRAPGLFWTGPTLTSGFAHGLDWKAWTKDFPEGSTIRITIEVVKPGSDAGAPK